MRKGIEIKQHDTTDCGAACLASAAAYYKLRMPIARIRQFAHTDTRGTNVVGMIEAANRLGFQAKGVKGTPESLSKIPKPSIAHVSVPLVSDSDAGREEERGLHYVVIYEVTDKKVTYMDPAVGKMVKKPLNEFVSMWTGVLVLLLPNEQFQQGNESVTITTRFWQLIRPHRTVMIEALFGAIIYTILGLGTSIYVQKIVDNVLVEGNRNLLNLMSIGMLLLMVLQLFIGSTKTIFALKTGQQIDAQLILGYYKHLLKLPQTFFDTMRVGEIISRVNDAVKIRAFINDVALNLIVDIFIVFFSFGLMFTYDAKLALMMAGIIPLYALTYWIANRINRTTQRKLMENSADLEAQLVESLNNVATIKRFGLEEYANLKTENRFVTLLRSVYHTSTRTLYLGNAAALITNIFTILLLWVGSGLVLDRQLTPGELLSFYALVGYFTGPAAGLIGMNKTLQEALIAADRLFEIMDLERETTENKVPLTIDMLGDIRFKEVTFRYGSRTTIFEKLNLLIPKGKITAVVGESGSGKSTLLSLLQNLYPLQAGNIYIGNYDIKHLDNNSLRQMVSVVPQQIDLFAGTVVENIAVGEFEPDMKKLIFYCNLLGITDFIERLPNGFQTTLGERGANLSGGQRQRLAIARALYRNPHILILDEATSALDSVSEQYVQRTIQLLRQEGITVILIAHRMSTIKNADKIVVLYEGTLVEEGTHQTLLQSPVGTYRRLWEQQNGAVMATHLNGVGHYS